AYKVLNRRTDQYVRVSLDASGGAVDPEALEAAERAAHAARYGRLEPGLAEQLAGAAPDERIPVMIWLREPAGAPAAGPEPAPEQPRSPAQWAAAVAPVVAPVAEHLRLQGHPVATATYLPLVYTALTPATIRVVAAWPEVDRIYLNGVADSPPDVGRAAPADLIEPQLNIAAKAIRADKVWARGITGNCTGPSRLACVAVLDLGGRAAPNPYLGPVIQDTVYACPGAHTMHVAGVTRSRHPVYRGIAHGAKLWVGGSCSGSPKEIVNRAEWALGHYAQILNASFGVAPEKRDTYAFLARSFDELVYRFRGFGKVIVAAVGQVPQTGPHVISPAVGYNVLAVGMVDARTPRRTGHRLHPWSADIPPVSRHGDRYKPEVLAPGVNIVTLSDDEPWIISDIGTSIAAPMVAGAAALLKTRDPSIGPERTRAILMASASWSVMRGIQRQIGAGEIEAARADDIIRLEGSSDDDRVFSGAVSGYNCARDLDREIFFFNPWIKSNAAKRMRVAIVWLEKTTTRTYPDQPGADLDLFLYETDYRHPDQPPRLLANTTEHDPPEKLLSYKLPPCTDPDGCFSRFFHVRVKASRCDVSPSELGFAFRLSRAWDWDPAN
ncbi:MAG TPA: S8 family serine peptidase, partial [Methylomirabilota bacterium]|nr:S8 family serine peptidase [Methylomirabilota bacterium]